MSHPAVDAQLALFEDNVARFGGPAYAPFKVYVGRDEADAEAFETALTPLNRVNTKRKGRLVEMYLRNAA